MFSKLKQTMQSVFTKRDEYVTMLPYADKAVAYAKDNPSEVTGITTLLLKDTESDVDELEDHTAISAAVDLHDYRMEVNAI